MEPLLAADDLSLSGILLAWSDIGHAATLDTPGCMASPGLNCVGDRPISTRCSPLGRRRLTAAFKGLVVSPSGVAAWTCHCASLRKANDLGEQVQTENEAKRHSDGRKATSGSLPQAALG